MYSNCIVGVYLKNVERTNFDQVKFVVSIWNFVKNFLSNDEFMLEASAISAEESFVNERLPIFGKCQNIRHKRDIEKHVSVKNKGARRKIGCPNRPIMNRCLSSLQQMSPSDWFLNHHLLRSHHCLRHQ